MSTPVVSDYNASYFQALQPGNFHQITTSASSVQSQAMDTQTTIVKLFATQDTWISFGINPTAVNVGAGAPKSGNILLRGGFASYFGIPKGLGWKIAAIQDSTGGKLDIEEGA